MVQSEPLDAAGGNVNSVATMELSVGAPEENQKWVYHMPATALLGHSKKSKSSWGWASNSVAECLLSTQEAVSSFPGAMKVSR